MDEGGRCGELKGSHIISGIIDDGRLGLDLFETAAGCPRGTGMIEEEAQEGRRVGRTEAVTEERGRGHRTVPCAAGEGGADDRGEGREAEEDLEQDVVAEGVDGGGTLFLPVFHGWRNSRRSVSRHCARRRRCSGQYGVAGNRVGQYL